MRLGSALAIFFLFWVGSAFLLLPFGVRTSEEAGTPRVAGQADSAPHRFDPLRHALRGAALAALLFALYYANWSFGWIAAQDLDFFHQAG